MRRLLQLSLLSAAWMALAVTSQAATVVATDNQVGSGGATFTPSYDPINVANDVLLGLTPTTQVGNFTQENSGGPPVLTDGVFGPILAPGGANHPSFSTVGTSGGQTLTYTLPVALPLSSLVVYGGWNDSGRDQQLYDVSYSTDGTTFLPLGSVSFDPSIGANLQSAVRITLTDNAGNLAGGVSIKALSFDFNKPVENGYAGITEIAAYAVPEPASLVLIGAGLVGLAVFARRRFSA